MKSPLDDARLRLSAVHPEMSTVELERAATKIAEGMTGQQITDYMLEIYKRIERTERDQRILQLQIDLLERAYIFQNGKTT